jgi:AcrR family transcriptional regulator
MSVADERQPKRQRADAERNRAKILDTARRLFSTRGEAVNMDEVARRAGVGVGTLYRHFPTKEALVRATAQQRFADIVAYYRAQCRDTADPLAAMTELLRHIGEVESRDLVFSRVVESTLGSDTGPPDEFRTAFEAELMELVDRGQAAGRIREDIAGADLLSVTCGLAAVVHRGSGDWRRYIDIVVAGLSTAGGRPAAPAGHDDAAAR